MNTFSKYISTIILILLANTTIASVSDSDLVDVIKERKIRLYNTSTALPFDTLPQMHNDTLFINAYTELSDMLTGKRKYDLQRAVFMVEHAYLGNKISYAIFCKDINNAVRRINQYIDIRNIRKYKTCVNAALFDYFTKPGWMNNSKFSYDFIDPGASKDITKMFVSKLIATHSGQCVSMPIYYKILCNQLGGKAFIALCPNHMYIKHIGEDGKWYNVELTTGSFARDEWYIEAMGITTEAIKNGVYLSAMSNQDEIAYMLTILAEVYRFKYRDYDTFTLACADKILGIRPNDCQALYLKLQTLQQFGYDYIHTIGQKRSGFIERVKYQRDVIRNQLAQLGFRTITTTEYIDNVDKAYQQFGTEGHEDWKKFKEHN
ncbi:MAG: hypothetical protein K2M76_07720 [Muribaculaceae bacterium]|nr:hypothetical protein [Muribaculaceae bacterium]